MWWEVFRFECRYQAKSPLFWSVFLVFFVMTFLATASEDVSVGGVGNNLDLNASYAIMLTIGTFSVIALFAVVAFVATAITRDFDVKTAEILFSTRVGKSAFLLGRFGGGFVSALLAASGAVLGVLVATFMPWLDPERIGAFSIAPYVFSFLVILLPNVFLTSGLFFAVAALTRSMFASYVAALGLIVAMVVLGATTDPENIGWTALAEPFGNIALGEVTRYWTVFQRNELVPAFEGTLAINRLIWVAVGFVVLGFALVRFTFSVAPRRRWSERFARKRRKVDDAKTQPALDSWSRVAPVYSRSSTWAQFVSQLAIDTRGVIKSVPFYVLLAFALLNTLGGFVVGISAMYGTPSMPLTRSMLLVVGGSFVFVTYIVLMYYAGELVFRERQSRLNEIIDASPFPTGVVSAAKIVATMFVVAMMFLVIAITAIIVQIANDYYQLEIPLYFTGLFVNFGWSIFMLCVFAVFIQSLVPNKWLGMLAFLGLFLLFSVLSSFGFEHVLYQVAAPTAPYSDINGYGHFLERQFTVGAYWTAFCLLLAVLAHLFMRRGVTDGWRERIHDARQRFTPSVRNLTMVASVIWLGLGGWIYYNTNVLNEYLTADDLEERQANYEKMYKQFEDLDRPEVVDIAMEVDIFPAERRLESRGTVAMINLTDESIDVLHLNIPAALTINSIDLPGTEVARDRELGYHQYKLDEPLAPGEAMSMRFDLSWINEGFVNSRSSTRLIENGTFVNNGEIAPALGYNPAAELTDNNTRRQYGLGPVERLPKFDPVVGRGVSQMGVGRRTGFRAILSTDPSHIAIAPGYLEREWQADGRRYFEYVMDDPIWPFLSFQSAQYTVKRDQHKDVAIEVYYHNPHDFNVDRMIDATKKGLDYFEEAFSSYQYRQFRIIEFPGYQNFAQAFANTIPYSENIGFIADLRNDKNIDAVFYVTAHELAHQWWAHQVIGARMQGMTMIVETLAQYSALMVLEREYGEERMRRFLKYELDAYLSGRGGELIDELPLALVENQPYIHYRKGSVAMYALKDAIGEAAVNRALAQFIEAFAFRGAPFPTTGDLIAAFRAEAGDEHQALITDLFERISLYDLKVAEVATSPVPEGVEVAITIEAKQFEADGEGRESEVPLDVLLDVAIFGASDEELGDDDLPEPLLIEKHRITSGVQTLKFVVPSTPVRVGVDPYHKMIDRNPDDNLKSV